MLFDNQKLNVNMSGKEYLDYQRYKDIKKIKYSKKQIFIVLMMAGSVVIGFAGIIAITNMFAPAPKPFNYNWNGIFMFMGVAAGLGWILHGTGFLIVRA